MSAPGPSPLVLSPVLLGRARELAALAGALDAARRAEGSWRVVSGEAGVGKSRLLGALRERARSEGVLVVEGACFEPDGSFPYAPIADALRALLASRSRSQLEHLLGPLAPEIVKLVPELGLLLPDLRPAAALDPEAEKRRRFESLARLFLDLAGRQPLLLVLEDLHWSDDVTLEYLPLLARRLRGHRLLLLSSHRPEEAPPALTHLIARAERERLAEEIALAPLSRPQTEEMVRAILGIAGPVAPEFLDPLHALTEGNPFAVEEVLKALIDAGELRAEGAGWAPRRLGSLRIPRSVHDAVQRRTGPLSASEREVLTVAVVAGRRFELESLREATGLAEAELLRAIKALVGAQLVVEESVNRFVFRHALTREAIYAMLLGRERQLLHRRVAEALGRAHAGELDRYAADLGHHYHAAEAWEQALAHARRAGEQAHALDAPRAAVEHYNRALDAAERLGSAPPPALLRARAQAYETIGYFEAARADQERAAALACDAGEAREEWSARIGLGRLWASRDYARTGEHFRGALELARELGDPRTLAVSLNRLGNWHANVSEPEQALRDHGEALLLFEAEGDPRGVGETLDLIGMASQLNGDLGRAHDAYARAIAAWRALGDARGLAASLASVPLCATTYLHQLDVPAIGSAEAVRSVEEGLGRARAIGWRAGEAFALFNLAVTLGPCGEWARALEAAGASLACAEEIEHRQWTAAGHAVLGMLHLDALSLTTAAAHLERAQELATALGSRVWRDLVAAMVAAAATAQGQLDRAERVLSETLEGDPPMLTQGQRLCWHARAELALARGETARALDLADALIRSARATAGRDRAAAVLPRLSLLRGAALARAGRGAAAAEELEAARAAAEAQGARALLWRIGALLGRVHGAAGRREDARAAFAAARTLVHELAAGLPEGALRKQFLDGARTALPRERTPSRARLDKERFGGLSGRQREVAALIALGRSNRAMADELGVGTRTVEAHVTQILMKLGFSSRAQVAAWAVRHGLGDEGGAARA